MQKCKRPICPTYYKQDHLGHDFDTIDNISGQIIKSRAVTTGNLRENMIPNGTEIGGSFHEVKVGNEVLMSSTVKNLQVKRKQLHKCVDEIINNEMRSCLSYISKLVEDLDKIERQKSNDDNAFERKPKAFEQP